MSERAVPYHCPYCGEQDLWPFQAPASPPTDGSAAGEARAGWECRGCLRAFSVKLLGMVRPTAVER